MCLFLECNRKLPVYPRLPLIAMLVLQARVSKRSVEQIAQFEVVLVTPVDRGSLWAAEPRADCGGESDIKNKRRFVLRSRCYLCLCHKDRKRMPRYSNTSPDLLRSSACRNAPQSGRWKCARLRDGGTLLEKSGSPCFVLLIEILTCLCRLRMLRGGSVATHACASTNRQFLCFHTTERHQRSHCFHLHARSHPSVRCGLFGRALLARPVHYREILERHDVNTVHESDRVQKKRSTHRIGICGGKSGSGVVQTTSGGGKGERVLHSENF